MPETDFKTNINSTEVLEIFTNNPSKIFNYKQVAKLLPVKPKPKEMLEFLDNLVIKDFLKETDNKKYQLKLQMQTLVGTIDFTASGVAYVVVEGRDKDIFIPPHKTKNALNGDTVSVLVSNKSFKNKPEGEIEEVIERITTKYVGVIQISEHHAFVIVDNPKIHVDFYVSLENTLDAKNKQKVIIEFHKWENHTKNPVANVIKVLGNVGEHHSEMHAIMAQYSLPMEFEPHISKEAEKINTAITKHEIAKRRDFRSITTFTIDPIDAKDFDDALSIEKLPNGNWEIGVHIADVTHYLKPNTNLNDEAFNRATSVYLVDRCVPMLPEVLSNFACSLRPNEEKYCFSAVFEMTNDAELVNQWFGKTVILSNKRFTYEEVQNAIVTNEGDYLNEIQTLNHLAKQLLNENAKNGTIFFDKEEVKFLLDDLGAPISVYFKVQQDAHKLIEQFMLLANKKVAEFLTNKITTPLHPSLNHLKLQHTPAVYRVHEVPKNDKLLELNQFVNQFGYNISVGNTQKTAHSINKLLKDVKNKKEQSIVEMVTLRSMPKALYTTKNEGHYGLGFEYYTHFTSPIRRYPDVLVHRLLEAKLNNLKTDSEADLEHMCKQASRMEKLATEAERASIKYKQVEFLKNKIDQVFDGVISGVTEWGLFVEITENKCEGLVRIKSLKNDHFYLDKANHKLIGKRSGKIYSLGDTVQIIVRNANLEQKQLDFEIISSSSTKRLEVRNPKRYKKRK